MNIFTFKQLNTFSVHSNATIASLEEKDHSDPIIRYGGNHAILTISRVTDHTFEIILAPLESIHSTEPELPNSEHLIEYERDQLWKSRTIMDPVRGKTGDYILEILRSPFRIILRNDDNSIVQQLQWPESDDGRMEFQVQGDLFGFDLDGSHTGDQKTWYLIKNHLDNDASSIPVGSYQSPIIVGEKGWAILFLHPFTDNKVELQNSNGLFLPNPETLNSPLHLMLTIWDNPEHLLNEYKQFAGESLLAPLRSSNLDDLYQEHFNSQ